MTLVREALEGAGFDEDEVEDAANALRPVIAELLAKGNTVTNVTPKGFLG